MLGEKKLSEARNRLLNGKNTILETIEDMEEALEFLERSRPAEFSEEAQEEAASISLKNLDDRVWRELVDTERALVKIENRTYGMCERCGVDIDPKRLDAQPAARYCFSCQQQMEQSRA